MGERCDVANSWTRGGGANAAMQDADARDLRLDPMRQVFDSGLPAIIVVGVYVELHQFGRIGDHAQHGALRLVDQGRARNEFAVRDPRIDLGRARRDIARAAEEPRNDLARRKRFGAVAGFEIVSNTYSAVEQQARRR